MTQTAPGFLLVDKDRDWTSHDVVAKVRRLFGISKVGHAGTLDPMATGLLVIGLDRATRLLRFVQQGVKEYLARMQLGVATDSLDADGAVLTREPLPVSLDDVLAVLPRFIGPIEQMPPMVSARKVEGKRLYRLAREGVEIEREARRVEIHSIDVTDFAPSDYPEMAFTVRCSTGTYVRTLGDDIARALGGRGHLTALRRTRNGRLDVEAAHTVGDLADKAAAATLSEVVLSPADALSEIPAAPVRRDLADAVRHGMPVAGRRLGGVESGHVRILDESGHLLAVYRVDGAKAMPEVVLA